MLTRELQLFIGKQLSQALSETVQVTRANPVGGGSINDTYQLQTDLKKAFFLKLNSASQYPGLFNKERQGLEYLQQFISTPRVITEVVYGDQQLLLLEWIGSGTRTSSFWKEFGTALARLHQQSQPAFGFITDNYMGALPQANTPAGSWVDFFRDQRLRPQVELASRNGLLPAKWLDRFEKLYGQLPSIFAEEPPSLLHGDLWSGNFICNTASAPVLIDPAVYYGHRSVDLAMTTLFGRFNSGFYEAYHYHFPLPGNYEEQWEVANLYPLLIHLNLFGSGYLASVTTTLEGLKM